jgi:hypothetical protein
LRTRRASMVNSVGVDCSLRVNILKISMGVRKPRELDIKRLKLLRICRRQVATSEELSNSYGDRCSMTILRNGKVARFSINI